MVAIRKRGRMVDKNFKIYEFDESSSLEKNVIVKVKVSVKAERLSKKCRRLMKEYQDTLSNLMQELNKDNPDVDINDFFYDDFGHFTGELNT